MPYRADGTVLNGPTPPQPGIPPTTPLPSGDAGHTIREADIPFTTAPAPLRSGDAGHNPVLSLVERARSRMRPTPRATMSLRGRLGLVERFRKSRGFQQLVNREVPRGQFSKEGAYYVKRSLTPAKCSNCPWFLEGERCVLVNETGNPDPGRIAPNGVCGLYWALPTRIRAYEVAYGRGLETHGVLPQVVRREVEARRWALDEGRDV